MGLSSVLNIVFLGSLHHSFSKTGCSVGSGGEESSYGEPIKSWNLTETTPFSPTDELIQFLKCGLIN